MQNTPYAKGYPKTARKFFDDFDLLPRELKEMLWNNATMPDDDDLKAAWQLAQETGSFEDLFKRLHVFEEDRKKQAKEKADREREQRRWDKMNRRHRRYAATHREVYYRVDPSDRSDKHARLIQRVSEEQLAKMASTRKENKDVRLAQPYLVRVIEKIQPNKPEPQITYLPHAPNLSILKTLHNAGGKRSEGP